MNLQKYFDKKILEIKKKEEKDKNNLEVFIKKIIERFKKIGFDFIDKTKKMYLDCFSIEFVIKILYEGTINQKFGILRISKYNIEMKDFFPTAKIGLNIDDEYITFNAIIEEFFKDMGFNVVPYNVKFDNRKVKFFYLYKKEKDYNIAFVIEVI